ncbi:MAG TPA: cytochrome P450 [Myxococcales bacterium]|nr:cytochrome P450 [Myxococcales bacterium]
MNAHIHDGYDPLAPIDWQDPYPTYRSLRDHAPVYFAEETGCYVVSRYADVVAVLKNPAVYSSQSAFDVLIRSSRPKLSPRLLFEVARFLLRARINPLTVGRNPPEILIAVDPPRHDELRTFVNQGFTPRHIMAWEERMRAIVGESMQKLKRGEDFDLIADLAIPLPVVLIAEILGADSAHIGHFKRWSDAIVAGTSGTNRSENMAPFIKAMGELLAYIRELAHARRADPQDDLVSILVNRGKEGGLDDAGIGQFVLLMLVAGNETTTNMIGNTVKALLENPEQLEKVRSDPTLIPNLIEESLRYDGPVQFVFRKTLAEIELAGTKIPAKASIAVMLGAANRDERQFEDPDAFDITRSAKGHLGFGLGIHFCMGASLARLEGKVALEALIPELPGLKAREPQLEFIDSYLVRGIEKFDLVPRVDC